MKICSRCNINNAIKKLCVQCLYDTYKKFDICYEMQTGSTIDEPELHLYKVTPTNENDILRCHHILQGYCLYRCIKRDNSIDHIEYDNMFIKQNNYISKSPVDNYYKVKFFIKPLNNFEEIVTSLKKSNINFYNFNEYGNAISIRDNIYDYMPAANGFVKGIIINNKKDELKMIIFQNIKNEYFIITKDGLW